ncbi:putative myosin-9 [Forsythia ovata]|uniref:Myosin-9 n=1 Tax=Forsythia ovata TaxID=205694 RepID=A0ABD1UB30_9LAMI
MACVQLELKSLYEKIAENQKVEEALKSTIAKLSTVQWELDLSKSQVQEVEQRLASKETLINELTQELELKSASESKAIKDIAALENQFSSTNENLQEKISDLENLKLKLGNEVSAREELEQQLKSQESNITSVQEELAKVLEEKEALEAAVTDVTNNATQMKELCNDLRCSMSNLRLLLVVLGAPLAPVHVSNNDPLSPEEDEFFFSFVLKNKNCMPLLGIFSSNNHGRKGERGKEINNIIRNDEDE